MLFILIGIILSVQGIASFYHDKFQGRKTASGEIFDQNKLTAAHKTLAFGTKLLVTNLRNGKNVVVTIRDRGPYYKTRILDLSKSAAKKIGITGIAKIEYKILSNEQGRKR